MKQDYLNKLEYNEILKILATHCRTYIGKDMAYNLLPSNNFEDVQNMLFETMQSLSLVTRFGNAPISDIANINMELKMLTSSGILSIESILNLSYILNNAKELKDYFYQEDSNTTDFPELANYFSMLYSNINITEKVNKCIIDKNTIADNASSTLNSIRRKRKNLEQNIKDKLNDFIHSSSHAKYIQEPIVTIRNDRYVIPVKEEYRSSVKGLIHDISSSGSTVFIEPISIFELNNEINNLKIEENLEIEKILQELSLLFLPYIDELKLDSELIGKLDFIFAKANYSKSINGTTPLICQDKKINLINARHPLISANIAVPISVELGSNFSTLIITGPNTGGKTVTLKTVGLLVCMACSGLNIPADNGSCIHVFDNVFADIGDNQSIANSLSTFSSHMTNIVEIVNNATQNSLILLDELGSGTDPLEGANLAISILEYFKSITALTISTTHYHELKNYAILTDGFENASVEFNVETLSPTYKLLIGVPGKSNAFQISKKLGLSQSIIDRATSMMDSQDISIEELLENIYNNNVKIEKDKEEIEKNLSQITLLRKQLEKDNSDLKKQEKDLIDNAKLEARKILLKAKEDASNIISNMNKIANDSNSLAQLNNLRNELNSKIKEKTILPDKNKTITKSLTADDIRLNLPVFIPFLDKNGIIVSNLSKSNEVQVQIGSMKTNINIKNLEKSNKSISSLPCDSSYTKISKTRTASSEINVIGFNVEEATFAVDKFLDDSYLAKLQTVRIVHGKGTGKLREGIHKFLKTNPHVKSFRTGTFGEGEMGVTIVELK